jgi:hypothetical protein
MSLVPYNMLPMTDAMILPKVGSSICRTLKSSNVENWLTQSATVPVFTATRFIAANLATDFASLAAVFDQYRIVGVEIKLIPHINSTTGSAATAMSGQLYTVIDYDDATNLMAISALEAYDNCVSAPAYQVVRRCFAPRIALAAYSGAFTSFANEEAGWIDCASGNVEHYGLKVGTDPGTTGALQSWDLQIKAVIEFRAAR